MKFRFSRKPSDGRNNIAITSNLGLLGVRNAAIAVLRSAVRFFGWLIFSGFTAGNVKQFHRSTHTHKHKYTPYNPNPSTHFSLNVHL